MFEMKTKATTAVRRTEQFFKELGQGPVSKGRGICYLVSLLEADNEPL